MNRYKYIDEKRSHLHTLDGKPLIGTSTVGKVIGGDKIGGLIWWASGMAVSKLGWLNPKKATQEERLKAAGNRLGEIEDSTTEEYLALLDEAYKAHDKEKMAKAKIGTKRHELLEKYVKLMISDQAGKPHPMNSGYEEIYEFMIWATHNIKRFLWSELHCYSEKMWTGGIADVGWEDMEGRIIAGDFKSSKEAYLDQYIQIAGYDMEISESNGLDRDGNKIFMLEKEIQGYCVVPFGGETLRPELEYDTEKWKQGFRSALELHKLSLTYKQ